MFLNMNPDRSGTFNPDVLAVVSRYVSYCVWQIICVRTKRWTF